MVLIKKAKIGRGAGSAMTLWRTGIRLALEVPREHTFYLMTKVDITPGADAPTELRTGYHQLLLMLKNIIETCVFLPVSPLTIHSAIVEPDEIPTRMSALMRNFTATSRIKECTG